MQRIRIAILSTSTLVMVGAIVLLLNFTAPNPTGRRYSSETPVTSGQGNAQEIGLSGERILARDLGIPRNEEASQRLCICASASQQPPAARDCNSCLIEAALKHSSTFRRPDFVGATYIAESKNRDNLLYSMRDQVEQIEDYAIAAIALKRPLWLYARVDTTLSPDFYVLVESTGGGVVHYFSVPGWVDPIDRAARIALLIGSGGLLFGIIWPLRRIRWRRHQPTPPAPMPDAKKRKDPLQKAMRSVSELESFTRRTEEHKRLEIDECDTRED